MKFKKICTLIFILLLFIWTKNYINLKRVDWIDINKIKESELQTGDIIILNKKANIYSVFGHSAVYIKQHNVMAEYPKIGMGLLFVDFKQWVNEENDRKAVVLRFNNYSEKNRIKLLRAIDASRNKEYKIVLNKKDESGYYCSQWVWSIYYKAFGINLDSNKGILTLPYDFLFSPYLKIVKFNSGFSD